MEYDEDQFLMLSGIQHFVFCRRQWALIHLEQQWEENYFTIDGEIMHKRAHDINFTEKRKNVLISRGMPVKSRRLGVSGICDIVEFIRDDEDGVEIYGHMGKYRIEPVEYKRGKKKYGKEDVLQVVAQAMCLEEMLLCHIEKAYIFYGQTHRREKIEVTESLRNEVKKIFSEMHRYFKDSYTPSVKKSKKCYSCSLKEICLPQVFEKQSPLMYIKEHVEE